MSVYFIRDEFGLVKIGHTRDPWRRLQALQTASGMRLAVVRVVDGGQKVEHWLHKRFADDRVRARGEWFYFREDMLTVIPPDEIPPKPKLRVGHLRQTMGEYLRTADELGLLSERMRQEYAPILKARA